MIGRIGLAMEAAYLRLLASSGGADVRELGDGLAVITGVHSNTENGVLCSALSGDVDGKISELVAWFRQRRVPARWLVDERVVPADLGARLVRAGCSAERTAVVMGAPLAELELTAAARDLDVVPVRDEAALARWLEVAEATDVLERDEADRRRRHALWASLGFGADQPLQHLLALRDGEVVGVVNAFAHEQATEVLHLGVLASHRRQGIGSTLLGHVLREARDGGCAQAILGPTPDTIDFYRRLGFVLRPWPRDRSFYLPL